jgi:hypothetical protein
MARHVAVSHLRTGPGGAPHVATPRCHHARHATGAPQLAAKPVRTSAKGKGLLAGHSVRAAVTNVRLARSRATASSLCCCMCSARGGHATAWRARHARLHHPLARTHTQQTRPPQRLRQRRHSLRRHDALGQSRVQREQHEAALVRARRQRCRCRRSHGAKLWATAASGLLGGQRGRRLGQRCRWRQQHAHHSLPLA